MPLVLSRSTKFQTAYWISRAQDRALRGTTFGLWNFVRREAGNDTAVSASRNASVVDTVDAIRFLPDRRVDAEVLASVSNGNAHCQCISDFPAPGVPIDAQGRGLVASVEGQRFFVPMGYGLSQCKAHDMDTAYCQVDEPPSWCYERWYYKC